MSPATIDIRLNRAYTSGMELSDGMMPGKFRPKLREMFNASGKTVYQVAKDGDLNYNTVKRYLTDKNSERVTTEALFGILRGLGYTWEEIRGMPLEDLYEIEPARIV